MDLFYNDKKTSQEIIDNIKFDSITENDLCTISSIIHKTFHTPTVKDAYKQLLYSNINFEQSIKAIDTRDGKIYGVLIFSHQSIYDALPRLKNDLFWEIFSHFNLKQAQGVVFAVDPRLYGTSIHKLLRTEQETYLKQQDIIWCGVNNDLKSHDYWKRLGFIPIFKDLFVTFYIKIMNNNTWLNIFIAIILLYVYEKNMCYRATNESNIITWY